MNKLGQVDRVKICNPLRTVVDIDIVVLEPSFFVRARQVSF